MAAGWLAGWWRAGRRARGPPPLPPPLPPPPPPPLLWRSRAAGLAGLRARAAAALSDGHRLAPLPLHAAGPSPARPPPRCWSRTSRRPGRRCAPAGARCQRQRQRQAQEQQQQQQWQAWQRQQGRQGRRPGGPWRGEAAGAAGCWPLPAGAARPDPSFAPLPAAAPPSISRPPTHFITLPVPHRQAQGQGPGAGEEVCGAGARGRAGGAPLAAACCASLRPPVGRQRRGSGVAGLQQCAWPAPALREPAAYSGRSCRLAGAVAPDSSGPRQQRSAPAGSHSM